MKNITRLIFILAAMLTLAACNKEKELEAEIQRVERVRDITYTVGGQSTTVHLKTEAEWDTLLGRFCDYAQVGDTVTFHNVHAAASQQAKENVTFSTSDRNEMKRWMARMEDEGMTVTVTFDSNTGTWNGTAYATAPQPPVPTGELITYEHDGMNDFGYIWSFDTVNHLVYITLHYTLQNITQPDYPVGVYEYRHADEVNTPFAYWLIDQWGDTAGLYNLNSIGNDTLHYNTNPLGYPATLVRTDRWHTYICSNWGLNIVMHVGGNVIEVYPEVYVGQMGVNGLERIDVIWPFGAGRFEMWRTEMTQPAMGPTYWGLTLDFRPFGGTDTLGGFILQGIPFVNNQFTISKENGSQFVFQRL